MFPLALLIVILLSIFGIHELYIFHAYIFYLSILIILLLGLSNQNLDSGFSVIFYYQKCFSIYIIMIFFNTNNFEFRNIIFLNYLFTHSESLSEELLSFSL